MNRKIVVAIYLVLSLVGGCDKCYEKLENSDISFNTVGPGFSQDSLKAHGYDVDYEYGHIWGFSRNGKEFQSEDPIDIKYIDDQYFIIETGVQSFASGVRRLFYPTFSTLILYRLDKFAEVSRCTIYDNISNAKIVNGKIYFYVKRSTEDYEVHFDLYSSKIWSR